MKKEFIIICLLMVDLLTSCGNQINNTEKEEQATSETEIAVSEETDTEQYNLSDLEKQIAEFKSNTPSETSITQDLLRGQWRIGDMQFIEGTLDYIDNPKLGELELSYDTSSKNSKVVFTNDEFMITYDNAEVIYGDKKGKKMQSAIIVSGLYRVVGEGKTDEYNSEYKSEIEMLITSISPKYGKGNTEVYDKLDSLIGTTVKKSVCFNEVDVDLSDLTEEQLAEYDLEIHDQVTIAEDGTFGYREDGTYGFILYDTPIIKQANPMTYVFIGSGGDGQLFTGFAHMKMKNSVSIDNKEVEPGVWLYDVMPHEEVETTE